MDKCYGLLEAGLNELGLSIAADKINTLLAFVTLIEKWNKTYNLTAIRNKEDMVILHILDSLAVLPFLQGSRILDIGTGAGLPGIPLALYAPDFEFVLLDSNAKKTRFVQQAILELGLNNVHVHHARVETFEDRVGFDVIISRAFSSLKDFLVMSEHLLRENGKLLAMKGQHPKEELEQLAMPWETIPIDVPGIKAERCIVQIEKGRVNG
jgi:16S rRNA (guanine527-N7)-methyltransferase